MLSVRRDSAKFIKPKKVVVIYMVFQNNVYLFLKHFVKRPVAILVSAGFIFNVNHLMG